MLIQISDLVLLLVESAYSESFKVNDSDLLQKKHKYNLDRRKSCGLSNLRFHTSNSSKRLRPLENFLKFITSSYESGEQQTNDGGIGDSDFCYRYKPSKKKPKYHSRLWPRRWIWDDSKDQPPMCKVPTSLKNSLRPVITYNISLVIFFDRYFGKRLIHPNDSIRLIVKGVQEAFDSYDMINEVGRIKFHVKRVFNMTKRTDDNIFVLLQSPDLVRYYREVIKEANKRDVLIWLTNAKLYDEEMIGKGNLNRLEGIARPNSFCRDDCTILVNCNSLSKTVITLTHEIAHTFSADHDNLYKDCEQDASSYAMSANYGPERNTFGSVSRALIDFYLMNALLDRELEECTGPIDDYEFSYDDIKHMRALSVKEQCQDSFSTNFKPSMPSPSSPNYCKRLKCEHGLVKMKYGNFPLMNGTPCFQYPTMTCCFGKCVLGNCSLHL